MFKWLKRGVPAPDESGRAASPARARPPALPTPAATPPSTADAAPVSPLPEVVAEGNTQADWSAWEDSMTALDSQMQGLLPTDRVFVRDTRPSQLDELDPFANVGRKRDL